MFGITDQRVALYSVHNAALYEIAITSFVMRELISARIMEDYQLTPDGMSSLSPFLLWGL